MADVGRVLDTSAILAYARGSRLVGEQISLVADESLDVLLPALCLAEAYRQINSDGWHYLDLLSTLPTAIETAANPIVPLVTAHRDVVTRILPKEWPIIDIGCSPA